MGMWPKTYLVGDDEYELRRRGRMKGRISDKVVNPNSNLLFGGEDVPESGEVFEMVSDDPGFDASIDEDNLDTITLPTDGVDPGPFPYTDERVTLDREELGTS